MSGQKLFAILHLFSEVDKLIHKMVSKYAPASPLTYNTHQYLFNNITFEF